MSEGGPSCRQRVGYHNSLVNSRAPTNPGVRPTTATSVAPGRRSAGEARGANASSSRAADARSPPLSLHADIVCCESRMLLVQEIPPPTRGSLIRVRNKSSTERRRLNMLRSFARSRTETSKPPPGVAAPREFELTSRNAEPCRRTLLVRKPVRTLNDGGNRR